MTSTVEVRHEFEGLTSSGHSGIEPRPLDPRDRLAGNTLIPGTDVAALNAFASEERAAMHASIPHRLHGADLEYTALTQPPEQALRTTMAEIRRLAEAHPFVTGAKAGTNNREVFEAWLGAGKNDGALFREGLAWALATKFSGATLLGKATEDNEKDESGEGARNSLVRFGSHSDDYQDLADKTVGRARSIRVFAEAAKKPGVRLAGELAVTMGAAGTPLEFGAGAATTEGLTGITYLAAYLTALNTEFNVDNLDRIPVQFFALHTEVDIDHYEMMIAGTLAEIRKPGSDVTKNTIVALISMRTCWFVGMKPWMDEIMAAGQQKELGSR